MQPCYPPPPPPPGHPPTAGLVDAQDVVLHLPQGFLGEDNTEAADTAQAQLLVMLDSISEHLGPTPSAGAAVAPGPLGVEGPPTPPAPAALPSRSLPLL